MDKAKELYEKYINNHPVHPASKFPAWKDLKQDIKDFWISKVERN